jgi:hypothetical protein
VYSTIHWCSTHALLPNFWIYCRYSVSQINSVYYTNSINVYHKLVALCGPRTRHLHCTKGSAVQVREAILVYDRLLRPKKRASQCQIHQKRAVAFSKAHVDHRLDFPHVNWEIFALIGQRLDFAWSTTARAVYNMKQQDLFWFILCSYQLVALFGPCIPMYGCV